LAVEEPMDRQRAHQLLDQLGAARFDAVVRLLEVVAEPLARSLALAPVEEEEITPETAAALDRARASLARGEGIRHEEVLREFGLSQCAREPRPSGLPSSGDYRRSQLPRGVPLNPGAPCAAFSLRQAGLVFGRCVCAVSPPLPLKPPPQQNIAKLFRIKGPSFQTTEPAMAKAAGSPVLSRHRKEMP
jgi:hypothetical protein